MSVAVIDLAEFLLARIAADEAEARVDRDWHNTPWEMTWPLVKNESNRMVISVARVLSECDAKRRIVESYVDTQQDWNAYHTKSGANEWLLPVLRLLAVPYADHRELPRGMEAMSYCAKPGCGQPVETMTCDPYDTDADHHGRPVVRAVLVTNHPCEHQLVAAVGRIQDAATPNPP